MSIPIPSPSRHVADFQQQQSSSSDMNSASREQQQPNRDRNDSSSTDSSGFSLITLGESLPATSPSSHPYDDDHEQGQRRTGNGQHRGGEEDEEEDDYQVDEHEKALRRYSADIAAHTAHMFETCYGGTIPDAPSNTASSPSASSPSARNSNRNSAVRPTSDGKLNGDAEVTTASQAMKRSL